MTREAKRSFVIAALLSVAIGFGGASCLVTGFAMEKVDLGAAFLFFAAYSVFAVWCFTRKRGGWLLAGVWTAALALLWLTDWLWPGLEALLYRVSSQYDSAYKWGTLRWSDLDITQISPATGVCFIACFAITAAAWTLSRRKMAIFAVFFGVLPLIACLVVTNTVPETWCLFILLSSMVLLMVTNTVRRRSEKDGNRLTAILLIPILLGANLLFWAAPRDGYVVGGNNFQQAILTWIQNSPFGKFTGNGGIQIGVGVGNQEKVDLGEVGRNYQFGYPVMYVTATRDGVLYLRGKSYDTYTGLTWETTEVSNGTDSGWPLTVSSGSADIRTVETQGMYYLPYYPGGTLAGITLVNGTVENPNSARRYALAMSVPGSNQNTYFTVNVQYISLPEFTKEVAAKHLRMMGVDGGTDSVEQIADAVRSYVSSRVVYDLNTKKMPIYETDFAMWFLDSGETGYCVHFATAAAVLLRSAGVPARYVTGYVANFQENVEGIVTSDNAHAWVEYLHPEKGWTILEATPSEGMPDEEDSVVITTPTQTTEPTESQTSEPTAPTEGNTEPSEDMTQPTDTRPTNTPKKEVDLSGLWATLKWTGILLGVCAAVAAQYALRLRLRKKKMRTGPSNRRALFLWREVLRYTRLLKKKPPEELLQLAEKAKFSQHSLTASERMAFKQYLDICKTELAKKPLVLRFLIRLIFAME